MNERLIQMTYNAYEQHLTILIDHNHQAFSRYSTIVQYLDEPFSVWADKIVGLLCAEINESPFILEYTGRAEEAEILSFFAEKCAECVRFEYLPPKVNISQQDRMYQLNQLVKRVSCQSVSVTNILIYTDGSFSEAEQNTISGIASINNRYCRMKVSSEDAQTDSVLSCRFCSFDFLDSALEKDEAGQTADYTFYFVRGVQNRFCGIKSGCTWIYEFDGTDDMFVQLLIKCLFVFPLLRVMRLCVQSLTVRPEIKDELLKITSIEPMLFITADDTVEVGRSIPVVLSMQSAGYPVPPIVCEFEREGIVEYRNNRFHGIKKGKTVARFYIRGDLKPAAVLNINAIERNRIKDLLLSETEIVLPENSNYVLNCSYVPDDADNADTVKFNSDNESVAIISNDGKLRTKQAGVCRIYCTAELVSASCIVTVKPLLRRLVFNGTLEQKDIYLIVGERLPISYSIEPQDCYDPIVAFRSSDYTVLNVKSNEMKAIAPGLAVLSVRNSKKELLCSWNIHILTEKEYKNMNDNKVRSTSKKVFFKRLFG